MARSILSLPLFLLLTAIGSAAMYVPSAYALVLKDFHEARSFFYSGTLGLFLSLLVGIALISRPRRDKGGLGNLLALFAAFTVLPVLLAIPFHDALRSTTFLNAYFEMVSCLTTTGATLFEAPDRLSGSLHLWRAMVGWMGGFLIWVTASAVLAPLNLGGFEVTASAEPGQGDVQVGRAEKADSAKRLARITRDLLPIYGGLTLSLWVLLLVSGDTALVALSHAMSTLATSGISAVGGVQNGQSGLAGEMVIFLFLLFALSRLTFSSDTITTARQGIHHDPEFRAGIILVIGVPLLLFLRHFLAAYEVDADAGGLAALRALWGGMFTVLSFLSTTGFESADWSAAREWSGLGTPGMILMGLALVGGGVATTAGGVKLLRVYALYLNGLREMHRLVHPSSVSATGVANRRIRRKGAYIAWIFFMLFALSLTVVTLALSALGSSFEQAFVLSISALSTTGPLIGVATETPIILADLGAGAKLVLAAAMVLGRLETLAIIALFNPELWRS